MSIDATLDAPQERTGPSRSVPTWLGLNHALTIFVSAFLLFQVQPLISKFILPWFGGSPAVWTTAMMFFQILLFCGYAYAHLVTNRLTPKAQGVLHGTLLLAAVAMLPISPSESWKPTDASDPTWRILSLLLATVGLPYFVLSTTGPLVQAWFSRAFAGRSPYRLYSLSNLGSLLALLSYPFVIEPAWTTVVQSHVWSGLFVGFALLCGIAAFWSVKGDRPPRATNASAANAKEFVYSVPTFRHQVLWITLPALASLMLLATTNHVCQDVAVVPFLWVVPFSLYLLTFIICFDHDRWYRPLFFGVAALVSVLAVAGMSELESLCKTYTEFKPTFVHELAIYFAAMFFVCMTCHGELVRLRPNPRYLTKYYLLISAGGALGGVFVSLIAPHVFRTFFEWKLALLATFLVAVIVVFRNVSFGIGSSRVRHAVAWLVAVAGLSSIVWLQMSDRTPIDRARNFYGVVSVYEEDNDDPELHNRVLRHGAIAHGRQFMKSSKSGIPIAYYATNTGLGRAIAYLQQRESLRVGTIGLGVGSIAAYSRPEDVYRFYEINPEVVRQAHQFFTFLKDAKGSTEIVMGDGRLALEREPPQKYDLLICDAFSGDSIPTHLATREAFEFYKKHLRPDGILAMHITNSYIDLFPMMRNMAEQIGMKWTRVYLPGVDKIYYRSDWMLMTNDQSFLDATPIDVPADHWSERTVPIWTDHFSNLFEVLR